MSQELKILQHMKSKPITPMDALIQYGCFRLAARIHDLRAKGYRIETDRVDDGVSNYARYWLEQ